MIPSSTAFANAINANTRTFKAKILHEGSEVDCKIIRIAPVKGACDGQAFTVGSVFSSSVEIVAAGLGIALENEDIELQIGVQVEGGTFDFITYGNFTIVKTEKTAYQTTLTGVGAIAAKLNGSIPASSSPITIQALADQIEAVSGVSISFEGATGLSSQITAPIPEMTCRAALDVITFLTAGFATENSQGGIEIHPYAIPATKQSVAPSRCLTPPVSSDDVFEMTGIKVVVDPAAYVLTTDTSVVADKEYYTRSGSGTTADPYVYTLVDEPTGNPAALGYYEIAEISYSAGDPIRQAYESPYMTQAIFSNYFAPAILDYTFMPAGVNMSLGDPRLEPWDCLEVTDVNGDQFDVPCHVLVGKFDGGFSYEIASIGESITDPAVEGSIAKKVDEIAGAVATTQLAASQAKAAAKAAIRDAAAASEAAGRAETAAGRAETSAGRAETNAGLALNAAGRAQTSAANASDYAARALGNLTTVQSVAETLTWITQHGTMTLTTDTELDPTHVYFVVDPSGDYVVGGTTYAIVTEPSAADLSAYYVLTIDESLNNYVGSHLAVTSEGLWLIPEDNATPQSSSKKILIAVGGQGHAYPTAGTYIIEKVNGSDVTVAAFTADGAQIGRDGESHLEMDFQSLFLKDKEGNTYFAVQDLRESDGKYLVEETLMTVAGTPPDGSRTTYVLSFSVASGFVLKVNGTVQTLSSDYTRSGRLVYFTNAPQEGDIVTAEYYSRSQDLKTYVLGLRKSGSFKGAYSVVAGYYCAAGNYAHAEGTYTEATGMGSHAEGSGSKATMTYSHAEGWNTEANGFASHAQNSHTVAGHDYQTVIGEFNDNKPNNAFEIGNGRSDNARSNAFEIDWNGNTAAAGDITDGSGNTLSAKPNASDVDAALARKADTASLGGLATKNSVANGFSAPTATSGSPAFTTSTYAAQKNVVVTSPGADYVPIAVIAVTMTGTGTGVIVSRGFDLDGIARGSNATVKTYWMNTAKTNIAANTGTITVQVMFAKVNLS